MDAIHGELAVGQRRLSVEREFALSHEQLPLWFLYRLDPEDFSNNVGVAVRLHGSLDGEALHDAITRVVARHESLRTTFEERNGKPVAKVNYSLPAELRTFDLTESEDAGRQREIMAWHRRSFDLLEGPVLRAGLFRLGPQEHVLVLTLPHILADLRSLEILLEDLETYYCEELGIGAAKWLEKPISYAEQVRLGDRYLAGDAGAAARQFWTGSLRDHAAAIEFPFPVRGDDVGVVSRFCYVPAPLYRAMLELAQTEGLSLHAILLAGWAWLIGSFAGKSEVVIGVPVSVREEAFRAVVGTFVNPLPIEVKMDGSFREVAARCRRRLFEALDHRQYPFHAIVTDICKSREAGRNPLFQTTFNSLGNQRSSRWASLYLTDGEVRIPWADLHLSGWKLPQQEAQVDFALDFVESDGALRLMMKGRAGAVPARFLRTIEAKLVHILQAAIAEPDGRFGELVTQPDADAAELRAKMNLRAALGEPTTDIVRRIDAIAGKLGDKEAITCLGEGVSYRQLRTRSVAIASYLRSAGVEVGDRVGVCLPPSADAVMAMLAIMRAGASYVPLDSQAPLDRLKRVIARAGIKMVFDTGEVQWPSTVRSVRMAAIEVGAADAGEPQTTLDQVAYTLFTSGSTGEPKGIDVRHSSVVALLDSTAHEVDLDGDDVWAWFHAASFDLSVWEIWGCLSSGARLVIVPRDLRARPDGLVDLLIDQKVTILQQTPSALRALSIELQRSKQWLDLKHIVSCGEPLPGALARLFLKGSTKLWNMYGPAETTVYATFKRVDAISASHEFVPIGRPLALATLSVLDSDQKPVGEGEVGELFIGGRGVAVGYVALPAETSARFLPDAHAAPGEHMYRTGDLVLWDGEQLHFKGRKDNQVKISGYRVELGDVEVALREATGVADAAAVIELNSSDKRLLGVIVLEAPGAASEASIRHDLAQKIPGYMVPARFLVAPALPVNAHHKLDRKALERLLAEGAFEPLAGSSGPSETASRSAGAIKTIWCETLQRDSVGLDDSFFAVGGNSLLLMQMFPLVRQLQGASALTPTDLFRFPTIRLLAAHLDGEVEQAPVNAGQARAQARLRLRRAR